MNRNMINSGWILLVMMAGTACAPSPPLATPPAQSDSSTSFVSPTPLIQATVTSAPAPTVTVIIPLTGHSMQPADSVPVPRKLLYDVASSGKAANSGDSYKINRFERPFLKDMTYVADLDIVTFNVSEDADWYYISIGLNGKDPNNSLGINYGAEIDLDADGFGDYLLWAHPPYTTEWDTSTVQVFKDSNHDSAGLSSRQSGAIGDADGYDTLIFNGASLETADPDLAWVRMIRGQAATIQFAFKKSLTGTNFMLGVVADAGLKDISKFDYNDYFKEADAGSSLRNNPYYPLGSIYALDNTCWEAYGIQTPSSEPKFCLPSVSATATNKSRVPAPSPTTTHTTSILVTFPVTTETALIVTVPVEVTSTSQLPTSEPPTSQPPTSEPPTPTPEPPTAIPATSCTPPDYCSDYDPQTCECN